jgi:hypothetical protein
VPQRNSWIARHCASQSNLRGSLWNNPGSLLTGCPMSGRRYKFDFRDRISCIRAKGALPGKVINIKVRPATEPEGPSIPAYGELDEKGALQVTFTNLSGQTSHMHISYEKLLWEIHCHGG